MPTYTAQEAEVLQYVHTLTYENGMEYHVTMTVQGVPLEGWGASPQLAEAALLRAFVAYRETQG